MQRILEVLQQKALPSITLIRQLCRQASNILLQQPNVLRIDAGVKVIGSLYGQYFDLLELINDQSPVNYLFLGNYIGHGNHSLQTFLILLCLKVRNPDKISLLRGMQQTYIQSIQKGFFQQIYDKYDSDEPWKEIVSVFQFLPLVAVIGDSYLAVSGGIDNYQSLSQIWQISRNRNKLQKSGLFWDVPQFGNKGDAHKLTYGDVISLQKINNFLKNNKLKMMIQSNGIFAEGYRIDMNSICLSICSCPYFLKKYSNLGAMIIINQDLSYVIEQFKRTQEPKKQLKRILS